MNINRLNYRSLVDEYSSRFLTTGSPEDFYFDQIPFEGQKELAKAYLLAQSDFDKQEIIGETFATIQHKMPSLLISCLDDPDSRFDPASEMMDEFVKALLEYVEETIDEDLQMRGLEKGTPSDREDPPMADHQQRVRDICIELKLI